MLENGTLSPQMRRHITDELDHLEQYQSNHPDDDHDPTSFEMYCDENPEADECRTRGLMETSGGLFNPGFLGSSFLWWVGQITDDSTWRDNIHPGKYEDKYSIPGWGKEI